MATTRISDDDHRILQALANETGMQQQEIIHEAIGKYQRERLLDAINDGFAKLKADKSAWSEVMGESLLLEGANNDGLQD